jgi:hypothetical protein
MITRWPSPVTSATRHVKTQAESLPDDTDLVSLRPINRQHGWVAGSGESRAALRAALYGSGNKGSPVRVTTAVLRSSPGWRREAAGTSVDALTNQQHAHSDRSVRP